MRYGGSAAAYVENMQVRRSRRSFSHAISVVFVFHVIVLGPWPCVWRSLKARAGARKRCVSAHPAILLVLSHSSGAKERLADRAETSGLLKVYPERSCASFGIVGSRSPDPRFRTLISSSSRRDPPSPTASQPFAGSVLLLMRASMYVCGAA
jgi:hypothetical protein